MERRIVVGDIHGCINTFRGLIEGEVKLKKSDTLFLCGDYIDRGPGSKAVIDYILWLQHASYKVVPLMGNHEYLLIKAMETMEYYKLWMLNSGFSTLNDFGIDTHDHTGPEAVFRIPRPYLEFFTRLRYYAETPGFFITHGCFEGRTENPLDDVSSMIWRREESYNEAFLDGRRLIHGHTPMAIEEIRRRINDPATLIFNLDAGCVYPNHPGLGYLAAVDLDNRDLFALRNCE
jgi:serine/threonine protein phosphatase 1